MKHLPVQKYWSASRYPWVAAWRNANTAADRIFYDVNSLSREEQARLSAQLTPEGHILIVYPQKKNKEIRCLTPKDFVREQLGKSADPVSTVVVAGVGSSALGTASLARDVADYLGQPVAGVVSGLGMSDIVIEAAGGWNVFGFSNALRDAVARTFDVLGFEDHVRDQDSHDAMKDHFATTGADLESFLYGSPDSTAVLYLLSKLRARIKLLVGHSKGNYSIENALEGFHQILKKAGQSVPAGLKIVTLGAVAWFSPEYHHLRQFLGDIDLLGRLNSRMDVAFVPVPGAWHSLNGTLPGHMSVAQALEQAGV